ncbi:MAG: PIG-L deacetylase family protein [Minisyncoccia bacterium]
MFFNTLKAIFQLLKAQYKRILIWFFLLWGFFAFGFGSLLGWFWGSKSALSKFPDILPSDRILVISPHIDDEILSSGGLMQEALAKGAQVEIVYLTNGDNNYFSIIRTNKNFKQTPNDFIALGEKRMTEAQAATQVLGISSSSLIFLGYPDGGLQALLSTNFLTPYVHRASQLNYNPYSGTYHKAQLYTGVNLYNNLKEIINDFQPTMIIVPHPRDMNTDHAAAYHFITSALEGNDKRIKLYGYLVHYRNYPPEKGLHLNDFLYPPSKLFSKEGWLSFDLTQEEEQKKLEALNKNQSQFYFYPNGGKNLLESLVRKNEIFEELN